MKIGRFILLFCCVSLLSTMYSYPVGAHHTHRVQPKKLTTSGRCKTVTDFKTHHDVYAKGRWFPLNSNVDIYVTLNKNWRRGDSLSGMDVSGGVETVLIGSNGKLPCTMVWGDPLTPGVFDIVVDANQDGTFDPRDGDAANRRRGTGFKVK
jgi:hypothetical protein